MSDGEKLKSVFFTLYHKHLPFHFPIHQLRHCWSLQYYSLWFDYHDELDCDAYQNKYEIKMSYL